MANRLLLLENGKNTTLTGVSNGQVPTWNSSTNAWELGTGGGGSGTVTSVSAGTGIEISGTPTVNPTVALAALDPAPTGTYGSASSVAVVTVDAYGRVTGGSSTAIALAASAITSGTLAVGRGGTGISTTPVAGGVVHGNGSTQAYTAAGSVGEVLISAGSGAPAFGALNLSLAAAVTGTLPLDHAAGPATANAFAYTSTSGVWNSTGIAGTDKLVGFNGSTPAAITVGTGLTLSAGTLSSSATGTVTSVSSANALLSVANGTTTPTLTVNTGTTSSTVAIGNDARFNVDPSAGNGRFAITASGAWSSLAPVTDQLVGYNGTTPAAITIGTGLSLSAGVLAATGGSVPVAGTAGRILYDNGSAWTVLAPGTTTQLLHSGTTPSWAAISLTADVSGTLPVGNGGTGATTLTQYAVLLGNGTSAVAAAAPSATTGYALMSNGASANPSFQAIPYDIAGGTAGTPTVSVDCWYFVSIRAASIAATGHRARCKTAPSATTTFTLNLNGASIGTVQYTVAGGTTGSVSITSGPVAVADGDYLTLTAPANLNGMSDPYFTLKTVLA